MTNPADAKPTGLAEMLAAAAELVRRHGLEARFALGGFAIVNGREHRRTVIQIADLFFHLFAWLERDDTLGGHVNAIACAWIPCLARFATLDFEDAEIA